jgi:hypothetical protein
MARIENLEIGAVSRKLREYQAAGHDDEKDGIANDLVGHVPALVAEVRHLRGERAAVVAALSNLNVTPDRACYDALELLGLMPPRVQ